MCVKLYSCVTLVKLYIKYAKNNYSEKDKILLIKLQKG